MADRREVTRIQTDRPTDHESLPDVREVLLLDAFVAGATEVLVGDAALDARVRWVHTSDSAGVARLLDGGELLLSTGSGWPEDPSALEHFVDELAAAGLSGVVLELGTHYRYAPAVVVAAALARGLAFAVLHREVKFVALTEAVHRRIISEQTAALRARDEVRERFTALALRGSPADFIVHQLAQTLGAPVVLENLAHEVVAAEVPPSMEEELFTGWEATSRAAHRDRADRLTVRPEDWLIVPVEARGVRWGHVIALPGPDHPAGRFGVLEQGATALALGRLAAGDDEWGRIGRRRLVDGLLAGRFAGVGGAAARLAAAGLPLEGHRVFGMVASGPAVSGMAPDAADTAARAFGGRALAGSGRSRRRLSVGHAARVVFLSVWRSTTRQLSRSHGPSATTRSRSRSARRPKDSRELSRRCTRRSTSPGGDRRDVLAARRSAGPSSVRSCGSSRPCGTTTACSITASGCWRH